MFTTTLSMWLGIAFLVLAVLAVLMQAWLWGPKFWDEKAKKTVAPRGLLAVHAVFGYAYGLIYLFMMWNMLPRLWEYQYELPARTVIHAVVAISIGVLLISKIFILKFFRHFEEAMPRFGFGLLLCTVVLVVLSVPYALRAHDFSGQTTSPENLERVKRLLATVEFEEEVDLEELASARGLDKGRTVLVTKCTACHDMRTILVKPRTAAKWHDINWRMLDKPAVFGERLQPEDLPWVTAYLVAITPDIQKSLKRRRSARAEAKERTDAVAAAVHEADEFEAPKIDEAAAEALIELKCIECHELEDIELYGGDDLAGWRSVVASMVEEGAELTDEEAAQIAAYLAHKYPGGTKPPPVKKVAVEPDPEPETESPDLKDPFAEPPTPKKKKKKTKKKKVAEPEPDADGEQAEAPKPKAPAKPKGDAAAGQVVFLKKCKSCHGTDGKGQTSYGKKIGVSDLSKSSLGSGGTRKIIQNGVSGTKMRGYRSKLTAQQIEDLVAFVKSLQ